MKLSERKRLDILNAARTEFIRHGFAATSMDAIAKAAATSKRTVYNHFSCKDVLFEAIVAQMLEQVFSASALPFSSTEPLREQLVSIARQEIELFEQEEVIALSRVVLAHAMHDGSFTQKVFGSLGEYETGIQAWLRAAHHAGVLRVEDPAMVSEQFIGMLKSFYFWPVIMGIPKGGKAPVKDKIIDSVVDMILFSCGYQAKN
ncbi:TetR/AcrR family transcriptional regulator [Dongshaea marina]|uniref:TetR/AcrR family transcriptional regulator n=1 Tax=Dongshaea marina TaxID=2047966 RepID=UPI000D3E8BD9|nr:TetR/AcrR family transcriptional regulator [Dongshaea marina]